MTEPRATRPHIPGYGIPDDDRGTLPWSWARQQLEQALVYWVASVKPDRHAHLMPTWGAWVNDRFYFEGGLAIAWLTPSSRPRFTAQGSERSTLSMLLPEAASSFSSFARVPAGNTWLSVLPSS